jgi:hypothetical protein
VPAVLPVSALARVKRQASWYNLRGPHARVAPSSLRLSAYSVVRSPYRCQFLKVVVQLTGLGEQEKQARMDRFTSQIAQMIY